MTSDSKNSTSPFAAGQPLTGPVYPIKTGWSPLHQNLDSRFEEEKSIVSL